MLHEIMPTKNIEQYEETWDTDYGYEIPTVARFRGNTFRDRDGIGAVFRQIPVDIVPAEKLGLSKEVQALCYLNKGLVLVTGPTGSGKSTTLAAMIDLINRNRKDHIITIEDPIEFVHQGKACIINQREVGTHTKSFKAALKAALREDPDVVLIGEMRDLETIAIAIETAETGHLVFGTLHTSTAPSTVDRLIDQFPADQQSQIRVMLASSLKGVISQTLCRKIGGGRIAALEILMVTNAVSNLIREHKIYQIPQVMQTSKKDGMVMLTEALFNLVKAKQVEPKEAYTKAIDKPALLEMYKQANISLNVEGDVH
jgi:twitching motility protein PilT